MILVVLRALFVLLMAAVGWTFVLDPGQPLGPYTWLSLAIALTVAVLIICTDILAPRRKLMVFSCVFTGLVVGVIASYALSFVVTLLVDYVVSYLNSVNAAAINESQRDVIIRLISLLVGVACCYLSISFVLQTGDDFRFIVPYVEFSRQTRGPRPMLLDTNVLIDGRVAALAETGLIDSELLVPQFVVRELRLLADSADKATRNKARQGLDTLQRLREGTRTTTRLYDSHARDESNAVDVDDRLLLLAGEMNARVMTNDTNLAREARVKGVDVVNLNDLATRLRPQAVVGERFAIRVTKPGESAGQGVGWLDDGTMVVVEDGRPHLNHDVEVVVTNVLQTSAGKMIFSRVSPDAGEGPPTARRPAKSGTQAPAT